MRHASAPGSGFLPNWFVRKARAAASSWTQTWLTHLLKRWLCRASMENTSVVFVCSAATSMCCNASRSSYCCPLLIADADPESRVTSNSEVKALVDWLKSIPVDQDTISKVSPLLLCFSFLLFHSFTCRIHVFTAPKWSCFLAAHSRVHLGLSPARGLQGRPDVLQNKVSCLPPSFVAHKWEKKRKMEERDVTASVSLDCLTSNKCPTATMCVWLFQGRHVVSDVGCHHGSQEAAEHRQRGHSALTTGDS